MFDTIKKLNELRNLQNSIKKERVEVVQNGVKIVMDGTFEVLELTLNPELDIKTQERILKSCLSEAKDKMQKIIAKNHMASMFQK